MNEHNYIKVTQSETDVRFPSFLQGFNRRWVALNCQAVYLCFTALGVAQALELVTMVEMSKLKVGDIAMKTSFSMKTLKRLLM